MNDDHHRRTDRWHFEKRLSLDTLVAIAGVALVVGLPTFYWATTMANRVQTLEIHDEARSKQEAARELDARDQRITVLQKVDAMNEQITQLRIDVAKLINSRGTDSMPVPGMSHGR